jgi:hypothetical protein
MGMSRMAIAMIVGGVVLAMSGFALAASPPEIVIRNVIGPVEVRTGPGAALSARFEPGAPFAGAEPASISRSPDRVVVDGGWTQRTMPNCTTRNGATTLRQGSRTVAFNSLPKLVVVAPAGVRLKIERALVRGSAGQLGEADLQLVGCSMLGVASVDGPVRADVAGGAELAVLAAKDAVINVAGGAEARFETVESLRANLAGGALALVTGGRTKLEVNAAGGATFEHRGVAVDAQINAVGGADVRLARTEGDVMVNKLGGAEVVITKRGT